MNYFDHAASSLIYPEVLEVLHKSLCEDFANPSSKHLLGDLLKEKLEDKRADFLRLLKAKREDAFYFTSSATESNNTVISGLDLNEGDCILFSRADHPSLVAPIEFLATSKNIMIKEIPLNQDGSINVDSFINLLDDKCKLVALTYVNNQSGVIHDIDNLSKMIKEKTKAHVHVDAVQAFGKIPLTVNPFIDSISLTSHKMGGPKGIAGLFLKKGHAVKPLLLGGGQEDGFRSSTEAYPLIAAFHLAMKISAANLETAYERVSSLSEKIQSQLMEKIPEIESPFKHTSPYIFSFLLPGISSDIILRHLEMKKIYISSTSACSSKISGFNPSLFALGIPERNHKNFLRISLSSETKNEEVETLIREFKNVWDSLKQMKGK